MIPKQLFQSLLQMSEISSIQDSIIIYLNEVWFSMLPSKNTTRYTTKYKWHFYELHLLNFAIKLITRAASDNRNWKDVKQIWNMCA